MLEPRLIKERKSFSSTRNHSRELERWIQEVTPHIPKCSTIAVLGLGDGHHVNRLIEMGYTNVTVFEFDSWVISCFETFHSDNLKNHPNLQIRKLYTHSYFEDDFSGFDYFLPFRAAWHDNQKIFDELFSCLNDQGSILNYHQDLTSDDQSSRAKALRALVTMGLKSANR